VTTCFSRRMIFFSSKWKQKAMPIFPAVKSQAWVFAPKLFKSDCKKLFITFR
jgi:hypothetical protein